MEAMVQRLLLITLLIVSCGGGPRSGPEEKAPSRIPAYILVEEEISGRILGQKLNRPFGLAIDEENRMVVCDAGNDRLIRFDPNFKPVFERGGPGGEAGLLNNPSHMIFDTDLSLLVSDEGNRRIVRLNRQLNFADEIYFSDEDDPIKFGTSAGVAVTRYGEVWVADREKNQVAIFDNVGQFDRFVGDFGYSGGQLNQPEKILIDPEGNFVVCDAGNGRLVVYDSYGNFDYDIVGDNLIYPIAAARDGRSFWVLDNATAQVTLIDHSGAVRFITGPTLIGNSIPLKEPTDLTMCHDGRMVIADGGNDRVLICRIVYDSE